MQLVVESERDAFEAIRAVESWLVDTDACPWLSIKDSPRLDRLDALDAVREATRIMRAATRNRRPRRS